MLRQCMWLVTKHSFYTNKMTNPFLRSFVLKHVCLLVPISVQVSQWWNFRAHLWTALVWTSLLSLPSAWRSWSWTRAAGGWFLPQWVDTQQCAIRLTLSLEKACYPLLDCFGMPRINTKTIGAQNPLLFFSIGILLIWVDNLYIRFLCRCLVECFASVFLFDLIVI